MCVLTDLSSLLTKGSESQEQERQLRKLIGLRDWMMAVLAFPVGVVSDSHNTTVGLERWSLLSDLIVLYR